MSDRGSVVKKPVCAMILAAGNGARMKSRGPKALCEVLFKPMIAWVRDGCLRSGIEELCVVIGPEGDPIRALFPAGTSFAVQRERLGTGHAVMQAREFLCRHADSDVLILAGDAPFVDGETIRQALALHRAEGSRVTILTAQVADPAGYGRIVRSQSRVSAIVEEADADDAERAIREVNSGAVWFDAGFLLEALGKLGRANSQGEYYLTDAVRLAVEAGEPVRAYCSPDPDVALGANDRRGLLALQEAARRRVLERLMGEGVQVLGTDGLLVSPDAHVGRDTQLYPGVVIKGACRIGEGCVLTSGTLIEESVLGDEVTINASHILSSTVGDGARIGPFSQLRPGSRVGPGVKIGDFVEVKNSTIGARTSVAHLTYVGDSDVGERVNFGCGVVTCNYDGVNKHRTTIGDDVFVGCNTNLVAPVRLENGAYTAAGSTITEDVPADGFAIARARQVLKPGRAVKWRKKH